MKHARIVPFGLLLAVLLVFTAVTPAAAFEGLEGDKVVIPAGEVIDDDLYVGANEFILEGTVNGDLIAFGTTVTINGTVNGDIFSAAQTVVLNGKVTGAVRMAGNVLFVGEKAEVGRDLLGAGYSIEIKDGSVIQRDFVGAAGQILLAGDVLRNVLVGTAAFELHGNVGGDVKAELGATDQTQPNFVPTMFMPKSTIPTPVLKPGLTIDPAARIEGNLEYMQDKALTLPAGIVGGNVEFTPYVPEVVNLPQQPTYAEKVSAWTLDFLRSSITHILIGLFLLWLFPVFVKGLSENLRTKFWPSLGWGAVTWVVFFIALMLIVIATIAAGILFGTLTLGQLTGTIVWIGILAMFVLIIGFVFTTAFIAEVVFGNTLGKWILTRAHSSLAENRYWPMVIGVLVTIAVLALLSFPNIPGIFAWLVNFAIILFGLGTMWIWARDRMAKKVV